MNGPVPPYPYGATAGSTSERSKEFTKQHAEAVREFLKTFGQYFPGLLIDAEAASEAMLLLIFGAAQVPGEIVKQADALRELEELCAALARIATLVNADGANAWLWDDRYDGKRPKGKVVQIADARRSVVPQERVASRMVDFLRSVKVWQEWELVQLALVDLRTRAKAAVRETRDAGRLNWAAVRAVGALQALWERETGKPGPQKALNPSSRFANFLRSGFEYLNLQADVRSAFNAWKRWAESAQQPR